MENKIGCSVKMKKTTEQKLEFARNVWFIFITAVIGFKLIEYLSSPSFQEVIAVRGTFDAVFLVLTIFILVYALFVAPALMIHVLLWDERKKGVSRIFK